MNDFTREELNEIKRCLKYMITGGTTPYSNLTIALNKKIQIVMDDYCEHKMDVFPAYRAVNDPNDIVALCTQCGIRIF